MAEQNGSRSGIATTPIAEQTTRSAPEGSPQDFAPRVVVAVLITLLLVSLAYLMWCGVNILLTAFAGALVAVFLSALSDWTSRHIGLSYFWSLLLVLGGLILLACGLSWLLSARLAQQVSQLTKELPQAYQDLVAFLEQAAWGRLLLERVRNAPPGPTHSEIFSQVTGVVSDVVGSLITLFVILVVGIFVAAEPGVYREGIIHLIPPRNRRRVVEVLHALSVNLRQWLLGEVFMMLTIGTTTALALWLMGIPLALTLGIIAGILEIVPYVGALLAAVPAVLIALLLSPGHALSVAALYLGLHLLEGYVLLPLVQRRVVLLPPALTIIAQLLLGKLLGVMGLIVAAPLTVCAIVLLKMHYVEDTLGDQNVSVPGEPKKDKRIPVE